MNTPNPGGHYAHRMACGLSVTCPVSSIRTSIQQRGIYSKIYEQIIETYNSDDIFGIQLIPDGWPKILRINLRTEEARNNMLVKGILMFGTTVTFKNDDSLFTKVLVKDGEMEWDAEKIKQLFIEYGEIAKVEREYIYFRGEKTDITTGTWFVYFSKLTVPIPRRREFRIDDITYPLQIFYQGQNSSELNQTNQTATSQTRRYCGMCGEEDHVTTACKHKSPVCFTCKKPDHATRECPNNDGAKLGEKSLVFYNARCPLSNWSTEYPFTANSKEYICVEQYIQEEKCYMFGDSRTAKLVMDETDPRQMRELTKHVRNYIHHDWMDNMESVIYKGMRAKFTDPQASGAKDYLLCTTDRTIGEATRNTTWGTGLHMSDSGATDPNKWIGANLTGLMLMDLRDKITRGMAKSPTAATATAPPPAAPAAAPTSNPENQAVIQALFQPLSAAETPRLPSMPVDSDSSSTSSTNAENVQPDSFLEEVREESRKGVDLSRAALVLGDHNTLNLSVSSPEVPIDTYVCSLGVSTLSEVKTNLKDDKIDIGVDNSKVDMVVIHLGSHEWDSSESTGTVKSAEAVFVDYEKLLNEISSKYPHLSDIVISGVPLCKYETPTDAQNQINNQIVSLNRMLFELSNTEEFIHFSTNEDDLYINPQYETLHNGPITFNDKGRSILADSIKGGICDGISRSMMQLGLQKDDWMKV